MPALARRQVLYVEDHPVNALLMTAIFERLPHLDLAIATSGKEALHIAGGLHPDLLLLDLSLPDCHGAHLLRLLRAVPGCEGTPAVAVTAHADFDIEGSGFSELWPKPLNLPLVLARLEALTSTPAPPPPPMHERRMRPRETPSMAPAREPSMEAP